MKKLLTCIVSWMLVLTMAIGYMPLTAFADTADGASASGDGPATGASAEGMVDLGADLAASGADGQAIAAASADTAASDAPADEGCTVERVNDNAAPYEDIIASAASASDTGTSAQSLSELSAEDAPAVDDSQAGLEYVEGEVLVVFDGNVDAGQEQATVESLGATADIADGTNGGDQGGIVTVELPDGVSVSDGMAQLMQQPGVAYAQPNYIYTLIDGIGENDTGLAEGVQDGSAGIADASAGSEGIDDGAELDSGSLDDAAETDETVDAGEDSEDVSDGLSAQSASINDPYYSNQWGLGAMGVPAAFSAIKASHQVTVAVLDTGVDRSHPDLVNNISPYSCDYSSGGYQYLSGDLAEHGTHVAGIIAAETNNSQGISGVTYNANILMVRVFNQQYSYGRAVTTTNSEILCKAYDYLNSLKRTGAVPNLHAINMSLGGTSKQEEDAALEVKIRTALDQGIITCVAAGNLSSYYQDTSTLSYPAAMDECISVGSIDKSQSLSYFSFTGQTVDVVAPGGFTSFANLSNKSGGIYSTLPTSNGSYGYMCGTSMASPMVAGAVALLYARYPRLTAKQARWLIVNSAKDLGSKGRDAFYGHGLVQASSAVALENSKGASFLPTDIFAGADRYETSMRIAQEEADIMTVAQTRGVIVCTGENFADALTASSLSGALGYPIVLTASNSLSPSAESLLTSLTTGNAVNMNGSMYNPVNKLKNIIIIGGTSAISQTVYNQLKSYTDSYITRIAGADRFATADSVYAYGKSHNLFRNNYAIVATGDTFADALSASPIASKMHAPVFLVHNKSYVTNPWLSNLRNFGTTNLLVVGGSNAISDAAFNALRSYATNTMRLAGSNRYATSLAVAKYATGSGILTWDGAAFANGGNFPDALAGGALQGFNGSVLLVVDDSNSGKAVVQGAAANKSSIDSIRIFGGTSAISQDMRSYIEGQLAK